MGDTDTKDYLTIQESFDYLANKIGINRDNINALATTHIYTTEDIENFLTTNNYIDIVQGDLRYQLKGNYYTVQDINNNYYTKTEIDFMLRGSEEVSVTEGYTQSQANARFASKSEFPFIFGSRGEEYVWGFTDDQVEGSQTTVGWAFGEINLTDTKIVTNQTSFNDNELITKKYFKESLKSIIESIDTNELQTGEQFDIVNWGTFNKPADNSDVVFTKTISKKYTRITMLGNNVYTLPTSLSDIKTIYESSLPLITAELKSQTDNTNTFEFSIDIYLFIESQAAQFTFSNIKLYYIQTELEAWIEELKKALDN